MQPKTPARHLQKLEQPVAAGCKHSNSKYGRQRRQLLGGGSWWTQACFDPNQGRHLLQEGLGLSSSTVLHGRGAAHNVVSLEGSGRGQGMCLNGGTVWPQQLTA